MDMRSTCDVRAGPPRSIDAIPIDEGGRGIDDQRLVSINTESGVWLTYQYKRCSGSFQTIGAVSRVLACDVSLSDALEARWAKKWN
jgi:hypothetical protein